MQCDEWEFLTPPIKQHHVIPGDMEKFREYLSAEKSFLVSGYDLPKKTSFIDTIDDIFDQRRDMDGKSTVGGVVHHDFDQLLLVWPNARYIYLVRDPRDVARSCVKMGWNGTAWTAANVWNTAHDTWERMKPQLSSAQRFEISYEQLIQQPEQTLVEICSFLGIVFTPTMLEIEGDTTYSKPSPQLAQSWATGGAEADVVQVEARVGNRLLATGYQHSGLPPLNPSWITMAKIRIADLVNRVSFRCKRYGVILWFSSVIAQRIPNSKFDKRISRQIQNIYIQHHK